MLAEPGEVGDGRFGAGDDHDVGARQVGARCGIVEVDARVELQTVEVGEVGEVWEKHDGHVHLSGHGAAALAAEPEGVLLLDVYVAAVGHYP